MHQGIHRLSDITRAIHHVITSLTVLRRNVKNHVLVSQPGGILMHTRLQAMFNIQFTDPVEQSIHEIIVNHAYAAERLGPGGFDACIEKLLEKFDLANRGNMNRTPVITLGDLVGPGAAIPTRSDVGWVLAEYLEGANERTCSMLHCALDLAGFAGRIIVEKTPARPSVELARGYSFDQVPAWPVNVRLERPKIVCIDGYVEEVSELHHLLEEASEARESVVLFVRGLSDDVKNTLKVNYDRGSLRVVPVVVKFDMEGINAINDISVVTGAELVSSNKGDLISNVRLSGAPRVDEVIVHDSKITITNTRSRRAVEGHVAFLRKKRLDEKIDDVARLFDARIKSLSPNHVVVRLPDDKDFVTSSQSIDYALRAVKALVDYGWITVVGRRMLTVTAVASDVHSSRCHSTLVSLGAMLTT